MVLRPSKQHSKVDKNGMSTTNEYEALAIARKTSNTHHLQILLEQVV
jgi:hypothetical protein